MTEEEKLAEEYAKLNARQYIHNDSSDFCTSEEEVKQAFLAGLKAKTQWHDLRDNPKDLPEDGDNVLCWLKDDGCETGYYEAEDFTFFAPGIDFSDVIAWCDLPIFED